MMAIFSWRPVHLLTAGGMTLAVLSCGASRPVSQPVSQPVSRQVVSGPVASSSIAGKALNKALPTLADDGGNVCTPNESVITRGGRYSTNVNLTASVALPGSSGVDVVMTRHGAIAAVNSETSSKLYWVDPATGAIAQTVGLQGAVSDMAFDGDGLLVVAANDKIIKLAATSGEVLSATPLRGVSRVAVSPDGYVGAIAEKRVYLYNKSGAELFSKLRDFTRVTDVEVLSCRGKQLLYVTSFQNNWFIDLNKKRNPVQIARLEAFDFKGEVAWSLFSDRPEAIKQNVADTRLYRVTLGRDGYLYIAGESAGTATIFRWRGQPLTEGESYGSADPFVTQIDAYSQLYNSGPAHLAYYARVNPTKGDLVTSQLSFPRRADTKSNTMKIGDIAGAADGRLYMGNGAGNGIPNRDKLTINGKRIGEYEGRDRSWMSVAPNFKTRNFWTVLADKGGKGVVQGVDAGYGYSAALSNAESGTVPVTSGTAAGNVFLSFTAE